MISVEDVLLIHETLISEFGGNNGVRDKGLLMSALKRPFDGFGDGEFYPTIEEKSAAIVESIVKNHPFLDGNKRSGYVLMRMLLLTKDKDINATTKEKYDFVIAIASGKIDFNQIAEWVVSNSSPIK